MCSGFSVFRLWSFALLLGVAACNTPTVGFIYTDRVLISVGGHDFIVYFTKTHAQAVRTNRIKLRQTGAVAVAAKTAIETASGCRVRRNSMRGDPGLITVRLNCA